MQDLVTPLERYRKYARLGGLWTILVCGMMLAQNYGKLFGEEAGPPEWKRMVLVSTLSTVAVSALLAVFPTIAMGFFAAACHVARIVLVIGWLPDGPELRAGRRFHGDQLGEYAGPMMGLVCLGFAYWQYIRPLEADEQAEFDD